MNRPWGNQYGARWTAEYDKARRRHLAAGLSGKQSAAALNAEFKTTFTKNAVIGRTNRLGEQATKRDRQPKPPPKRHVKPKKQQKPLLPKIKPPTQETKLRRADVVPLNLRVLELTEDTCKWPYGERDFTFCGNPPVEGYPYCFEHWKLSIRCEAA